MRRRAGLGLLLLLAQLLTAACQAAAAPAPAPAASGTGIPRTFTEALAGPVGYLNPLFADEDNAREIDGLIYQGLTRVGADQQPEPLLASSIAVSADLLTYTANLRPDLSWADGSPLTIDDVLFTFAALQDPAYQGPEAEAWKGVTVRAAGDHAVDFVLKAPSAAFPLTLRIGILPAHLFPGSVGNFPTSPHSGAQAIGSGPFMVESLSADHSLVTLRRNPRAVPVPRLEKVVFRSYPTLPEAARAVARGEADAVGGPDATALAPALHLPAVAINETPTFSFTAAFLNLAGAPDLLGSAAVRHALSLSVDRAALVGTILGGRGDPQWGALPPREWAYSAADAGAPGYDRAAAITAFEEAGWTLSAQALHRTRGGRELVLHLVAADASPYRQLAAALRLQLLGVGVGLNVELVPVAQLIGRYLLPRNYDLLLAGYDNGPDPDQYVLWHSSQSGYPLNTSGLPRQAFIDKDLEDGRAGADPGSRRPAYADLQRLLAAASPALFLYEPHYLYAVAKRIRGLRMNSVIEAPDRFEYVAEWFTT